MNVLLRVGRLTGLLAVTYDSAILAVQFEMYVTLNLETSRVLRSTAGRIS